MLKPRLVRNAGEWHIVLNLFLNCSKGVVQKLTGSGVLEVQGLRRIAESREATSEPANVGGSHEPIAGEFPLKASSDGHFVRSLVIRIEVKEWTCAKAAVEEPDREAGVIDVRSKRWPRGGAATWSRWQIVQTGETRIGGQISKILRDGIAEEKAGLIEFESLADEVDVIIDAEAGTQAGLAISEQVSEETAGKGWRVRQAQAWFEIGEGGAVVARAVVRVAAQAVGQERNRVWPGNSLGRVIGADAEDLRRGHAGNGLESVHLGKGIVILPAQSVGDSQARAHLPGVLGEEFVLGRMIVAIRNQTLRECVSVDVIVERGSGAGIAAQREGEERTEFGGVAVKIGGKTSGGEIADISAEADGEGIDVGQVARLKNHWLDDAAQLDGVLAAHPSEGVARLVHRNCWKLSAGREEGSGNLVSVKEKIERVGGGMSLFNKKTNK